MARQGKIEVSMMKEKKEFTGRISHRVRAFCWHPGDDKSYDMYITDNPSNLIIFKCTRCKHVVAVGAG